MAGAKWLGADDWDWWNHRVPPTRWRLFIDKIEPYVSIGILSLLALGVLAFFATIIMTMAGVMK
jgi:hypothetical protein